MNSKAIKIEIHAFEPWLTLEWQKKNLAPLEAIEPEFKPDTDVFLFYEDTVVDPRIYTKAPIEKRFGLLTEPSIGRPFAAQSISHVDKFRAIYTHDPLLLSLHPNYRWNPFGTSWVFREDDMAAAPHKSKTISIITSNLSRLNGHKLRLSICKKLHERKCGADIFGRNIPWGPYIKDRRDAIAPYLFTIAIENCRKKNYFSEKLIDPLITRTIPIYWGCPNIADFLNTKGMIIVRNEQEFWRAFTRVMSDPVGIYESYKQAAEENCGLAIEKYNAKCAWGNVATEIAGELGGEFHAVSFSVVEKLKLWFVQQVFLAKEHGLNFSATPFIPQRLKPAIRELFPI
ncbi:MAG: glycosyltransferase family 10 [Sedimentisphaerales bacterium]|nr:glycosyltransferase family 10 [Sedimentisphaerales bacterium]